MGMTSYAAAPSSRFGLNARCISSILNVIAATGIGAVARVIHAVTSKALATTRASALALGLFFTPPFSDLFDTIPNPVAAFVPADIGNLSFISPAEGQPAALTKSQSDALTTYTNAVKYFNASFRQRPY